jgi:hypothetical protein
MQSTTPHILKINLKKLRWSMIKKLKTPTTKKNATHPYTTPCSV